ncbi:MAG: shikimate kinase [Planctomycetaceae bacterium]
MVISLIGYRASGKSSIAPRLAKKLGWEWQDCDRVIEQRAGCTIPEIFAAEGETGFRQRESTVLAELLQSPQLVLATGGGAILNPQNRQLLRDAGPVVWLYASPATLVSRLSRDRLSGSVRPSLTGRPIDEEVTEVLAIREPLYREAATLTVHSDGEPAEQVARRILRHLGLRPLQETSHDGV